jgi:predicted enzyme related to lactoylglutathione lyase
MQKMCCFHLGWNAQLATRCEGQALRRQFPIHCEEKFTMAVTRIVANLSAPDPIGLAKFYQQAFELDLPFEMGWIAFLTNGSTQKIELHTASEGGSGTDLPVISIGVDDLVAAEAAVRAAGADVVYGPVTEDWGLRRFFFRDPAGNLVNVVDS